MNLDEVRKMKRNVDEILRNSYKLDETSYASILDATIIQFQISEGHLLSKIINKYWEDKKKIKKIKKILRQNKLPSADVRQILKLIKNELSLNNRIERLQSMQQLFKYWHVAHLPFAIIMLVILIIHVGITLVFGYT